MSPTVYFPDKKESWNLNPSIDQEKSLFETPVTFQSTAFNVAGFVFSPAYRQSAYQVYNVAPNPITKGLMILPITTCEMPLTFF